MIPREKLNEVVYFQSYGNYVKVHYINGQQQVLRSSLKKLDTYLPNTYFTRIHQRYIVQLRYIHQVNGNSQGLWLDFNLHEDKIKVSRKYIQSFKKTYSDFQEADILFSKNDPGYFF